ncbi:hypothetical protein N656DRAFT_410214 [Canariomyces notabilis]|uniref:Uncharacterized protein n=1 Tax=Canariomyces notabilis TaxID=2074819 RepID=A0AAN6YWC8_9PEZI|nr:hypothetical protein N656DRAFT_410214 [Canariomyces arenarius]
MLAMWRSLSSMNVQAFSSISASIERNGSKSGRSTRRKSAAEAELFRSFTSDVENVPSRGGEGIRSKFNIDEEAQLLNKVKDIRDELKMIKTIFQTQREILECLSDFKAVVKDVDTRVKDVGRIDRYAYQTEEALKHLLDLKQKQANMQETHFLSIQNDQTAKQGQAITTFTIVTIVFAPLSFLTSFFAIEIEELARPMTLAFVLRIICESATQTVLQPIQH